MKKILMVCLGNICRSPMAQGIMEQKLKIAGVQAMVDSAGTADYHVGEAPDTRAVQTTVRHSVDISAYRGRQFTTKDFDMFDHIYAMDTSNLRDIHSLARSDHDKNKTDLILNRLYPGENMSVPDPYYGDKDGFENVFRLLDRACDLILEDLTHGR